MKSLLLLLAMTTIFTSCASSSQYQANKFEKRFENKEMLTEARI